MKGKLIVITGIDGSGKTVQCELFARRLEKEGYDVKKVDFPQYGKSFFADLIARYLRGDFNEKATKLINDLTESNKGNVKGEIDNQTKLKTCSPKSINPYFTSLLYAGDRWECREKIVEWLDKGKIIISNRYACCNKAYQGAKIENVHERKQFFDWVNTLEYDVYKIPVPDLIIFLQNDVDIALDLISKRPLREYHYPKNETENNSLTSNSGFRDIHEEDVEYLKLVEKMYYELASSENGWKMINCIREGRLLDKDQIAERVWDAVREIIE